MYLVFTDLDGTLLDHETYSWEPAAGAIRRLVRASIPWIFVTSKTRAETEVWREKTGNRHPFIVENGGAVVIPNGYFPTCAPGAILSENFETLRWGEPYELLTSELRLASEETGCRVRGFRDMTTDEVAALCGLPLELAHLAKQREYDEPFVILDHELESSLVWAIQNRGFRCTQGGRFWHITGANDKGAAVRAVTRLYDIQTSALTTIGLGDGLNDFPLLKDVDVPVIVRSRHLHDLQKLVPKAIVTTGPGPAGWSEALLEIIPELR